MDLPHYERPCVSDENIFFTATFSLAFSMGAQCALVGTFA